MKKFPHWAFIPKVLREWAKGRKLKTRKAQFRIVFFNQELPVGELWRRPHLLQYDEKYKTVYGRFGLEVPDSEELFWITIPYYHSLEGFYCAASSDLVYMVTGYTDLKYYTTEERDLAFEKFAKREETESWLQLNEDQHGKSRGAAKRGRPRGVKAKEKVKAEGLPRRVPGGS